MIANPLAYPLVRALLALAAALAFAWLASGCHPTAPTDPVPLDVTWDLPS